MAAKNHRVIHVNDDTHARVKAFCEARHVSMNEWLADLVETVLAFDDPREPPPPPKPMSHGELAQYEQYRAN